MVSGLTVAVGNVDATNCFAQLEWAILEKLV